MIEPEGDEKTRHAVEHQTPRELDITREHLKIACKHHQQTLTYDGSYTIECASYAHEISLFVLVETEHIETIGSDVVSGTRESHQPEERQRALKPIRSGNGEGHTTKSRSDKQLHGNNPPALGLDDIDEGTPQGFYHPRQIEPGGIERDVGVRQSQTFVHDKRDGHYSHIRQTFRKIKSGHPCPRISFTIHINV